MPSAEEVAEAEAPQGEEPPPRAARRLLGFFGDAG